MSNFNVRIVGTADVKQIKTQFAQLEGQVASLNAQMKEYVGISNGAMNVNPQKYAKMSSAMQVYSQTFRDAALSTGMFEVEQLKVNSATDEYVKRLNKQKISLRQMIKEWNVSKAAYKEQIAMQQMYLKKMPGTANGRQIFDVVVPNEVHKDLDTVGKQIGWIREQTRSAATQMVNWGKNTQWAGRQLMVGFTMPVAAFGAAAGAMAYQIDAGLTRVQKVYNTTAHVVNGDSRSMIAVETELAKVRQDTMNTAMNAAKTYGASVKDTIDVSANLAAAGLKGQKLQTSTNEVMRLATLGEMDYHDALSTTIALQTAFRLNTNELNKAFNFMNATENATSLSIQDITEATPRAASAMSALGVSVEQMTVMLVAMKSAGVDAAQGANALKSATASFLAPTDAAQKFISQISKGKVQIQEISKAANGNLYKAMEGLYQAMQGLGDMEKRQILVKLFGKYQFNRIAALLDNLGSAFEGAHNQTHQAMQLMGKDATQLANIADTELRRYQESAAGTFKRTLETVKGELAQMGEPFLEIATDVLKAINAIMEKFNDLPDGAKKFIAIAAVITAAVGPLIMLSGLFLNLVGNLLKGGVALTGFLGKMEILDKEAWVAKKATELATAGFTTEADAVSALTARLDILIQAQEAAAQAAGLVEKGAMDDAAAAEAAAVAAEKEAQAWRDLVAAKVAAGRPVDPRLSGVIAQKEIDAVAYRGLANNATTTTAKAAEAEAEAEQKKSVAGKAFAVSAGLSAAAMTTMMISSNETVDNFANLVMYASILAPMMAGIPWAKMGTGITAAASAMKGGFVPAAMKAGGFIKDGVLSFTRFVGPTGLIAAAVAGMIVLNKWANANANTLEKMNSTADTWGKIFGYQAAKRGEVVDPKTGQVIDTLASRVEKLNEAAPEVGKSIKKAFDEAGGAAAGAAKQTQALDMAIRQGLQVVNSGGSATQAREAVRTALMAGIGDVNQVSKLMKVVDLRVKFNVNKSVLHQSLRQAMKEIATSVDNAKQEGTGEKIWNIVTFSGDEWSKESKKSAETAAETFFDEFNKQSVAGQRQMALTLNNNLRSQDAAMLKHYESLNPQFKKLATQYGATTMSELDKALKKDRGYGFGGMADGSTVNGPVDQKTAAAVQKYLRFQQTQVMFAAKLADLGKVDVNNLRNANQVFSKLIPGYLTREQAERAYNAELVQSGPAMQVGLDMITGQTNGMKDLTDKQKLRILNEYRAAAGLEKTGNLLDGFGPATEKWVGKTKDEGNAVDGVNGKLRDTKSLIDSIKNSDITDLAKNAMQSYQQGIADATTNDFDTRMNNAIAATEAAGQAREDAMQRRHQNALDAFDKHWDHRQKAVENGYDKRIQKIHDEMDAEQKADDLRQKLFEREMTRLDRLNESANRNIDFNVALNQGNFDEAAKIRNDAEAQAADYILQDAAGAGKDKSQKRQDKMQKHIDALEKEKQRRLDNIKEVEDKERKALERSQKRQEDALKKQVDATNAAEKKKWDIQKKNLDAALQHFLGYTATSDKDLQKHIKEWEDRYKGFNLVTKGQFNATTKSIAAYLKQNLEDSRAEFANQKEWATSGYKIASAMLKGAFGMNTQQFKQWLITGVWPNKAQPPTASDISKMYGGGAAKSALRNHVENSAAGRTIMHTGGMIGKDKGGRVGYARTAPVHRNEVPLLAEKGEFMINKNAARKHAPLLSAINNDSLTPASGIYQEKPSKVRGAREKGGPSSSIGAMGFSGLMGALMAKAIMSTVQTGIASGAMNAINQQTMMTGAKFGTAKPGVYGDVSLTEEQLKNAAIIASVGSNMGMSQRDIVVGLMTSLQESGLRNLHYGDRDSQGLFQQRPSAGWGTVAQVTNPKYAATKFFESLKRVPNRDSMALTLEAQAVQRSAYPYAYAKWENEARAIMSAMHKTKKGYAAPTGNITGAVNGIGRRAISWASAHLGDSGWYNLCQSFVRQSLGAPGGAPSAISAWYNARFKHSGVNPKSVPPGVPVFWSGGAYGHTALSTGGGNVISTDYPVMGKVGRGTIAGISRDWNKHFLGWTEDENGKRVYGLPGLKTGGFTLNDGLAMLHEGEAVMTKPLTQEFHDGVKNFAQGGNNTYNINVNVTQPNASADQIAAAVKRSIRRDDARKPQSRKR